MHTVKMIHMNIEDNDKRIMRILQEQQLLETGRDNPEKDFSYALMSQHLYIGGITARLWHKELHINFLAVDEAFRNNGYGTKLLKQVEQDAVNYGATIITITTQDYQALSFYKLNNYQIFGQLADCPFPGTTRYYLFKQV